MDDGSVRALARRMRQFIDDALPDAPNPFHDNEPRVSPETTATILCLRYPLR
jgi:hypothetical protein